MQESLAHVTREYLPTVVFGAGYAHLEDIGDIMLHVVKYGEVITKCLVCYCRFRREIDDNFIYSAFNCFPDSYCAECSRYRGVLELRNLPQPTLPSISQYNLCGACGAEGYDICPKRSVCVISNDTLGVKGSVDGSLL